MTGIKKIIDSMRFVRGSTVKLTVNFAIFFLYAKTASERRKEAQKKEREKSWGPICICSSIYNKRSLTEKVKTNILRWCVRFLCKSK